MSRTRRYKVQTMDINNVVSDVPGEAIDSEWDKATAIGKTESLSGEDRAQSDELPPPPPPPPTPSTRQAPGMTPRATVPGTQWAAPVEAPSAPPPAPSGGAERMIHRLIERLESHALAAGLSSTTAAPRARPDYAPPNIAMRRALTSGDGPRARDLRLKTRGAARRILKEVLLLIGDVAVISHDLELQSCSHSLVRADGAENVMFTGSPSEIRQKPVRKREVGRKADFAVPFPADILSPPSINIARWADQPYRWTPAGHAAQDDPHSKSGQGAC